MIFEAILQFGEPGKTEFFIVLELWAYKYSAYCWTVRLMLREKQVLYGLEEINPFLPEEQARLKKISPLGKVPVLVDEGRIIFETSAIIRYVDRKFPGETFTPADAGLQALQDQIIAVADQYAYWPWVRQVFSNAVFAPKFNETVDQQALEAGLERSVSALAVLEALALDTRFLCGERISLADFHLLPMLAYLAKTPEGLAMLEDHRKLLRWFEQMGDRASVIETAPPI